MKTKVTLILLLLTFTALAGSMDAPRADPKWICGPVVEKLSDGGMIVEDVRNGVVVVRGYVGPEKFKDESVAVKCRLSSETYQYQSGYRPIAVWVIVDGSR